MRGDVAAVSPPTSKPPGTSHVNSEARYYLGYGAAQRRVERGGGWCGNN